MQCYGYNELHKVGNMATDKQEYMSYEEWNDWVQCSLKLSRDEITDHMAAYADDLVSAMLINRKGPMVVIDGALLAVATVIGMAVHGGSTAMPAYYKKRFITMLNAAEKAVYAANKKSDEQPQA